MPVNMREPEASDQCLARDVDYAIAVASNYLSRLAIFRVDLNEKSVLEIGPGVNLATALVLAGHGARVAVLDRFLPPWYDRYHSGLYQRLKQAMLQRFPNADIRPVERVLSVRGYPDDVLAQYSESLEDVSGVPDSSVDVVLSNAVLEHLYDTRRAIASMARICRPGALGFHQVDFRDHANFDRPLEYLLFDNSSFERIFVSSHGERGNRLRPREMTALFVLEGFEILKFETNQKLPTEGKYLRDFKARLREAVRSPYHSWPGEELAEISGHYTVKRVESSTSTASRE